MAISPNTCWEVDAANGNDANGGGFVAGGSGTDKTYGAGANPPAGVSRSDLALTAIGAPASAPTVSDSGTGGTVAAGTYYFVVTYVSYYGTTGAETNASAQAPTTTAGTTSTIAVTSPPAAVGATHYQVYAGTAPGGPYYLVAGTYGHGTPLGTSLTIAATPPTTGATPPASDASYVNATSAATAFAASDVGNAINVSAGTGWTAGFYQVVAFDATSGKATVDRSPTGGAAPGGAGTGVLGGAWGSFSNIRSIAASNKVFIRSTATYTAGIYLGAGVTPGAGSPPTRIAGYDQTRGDIDQLPDGTYRNNAARPTLSTAANPALTFTGGGIVVEHLIVDGQGAASSSAIQLGPYGAVRNCLAKDFGGIALQVGTDGVVLDCEVTGGVPGATAAIAAGAATTVANCHVHDNACAGIYAAGAPAAIVDNLVVNNTGAQSDGVQAGGGTLVLRNTIRGNGRHGIYNPNASLYGCLWRDNVIALNGTSGTGYGIFAANAAGLAASPAYDGNAYYNNRSGARHFADDTGSNVAINGVAPYTNRLDVTLSGSPFVSDTGATSTSNFALNAAAGAACRGAGTPRAWPLASRAGGIAPTASAPCLGAAQTAAGGGGISKGRFLGGD